MTQGNRLWKYWVNSDYSCSQHQGFILDHMSWYKLPLKLLLICISSGLTSSQSPDGKGALFSHFQWENSCGRTPIGLSKISTSCNNHCDQGRGHMTGSAWVWWPLPEPERLTVGEGDGEGPRQTKQWKSRTLLPLRYRLGEMLDQSKPK